MPMNTQQSSSISSTSELFHTPGPDSVAIESSDNVLFFIRRTYLEINAGAFPPANFSLGADEVVKLTEDSTTLELLFQFVCPQRQPTLSDTKYDILAPLAEAAEKYEVYSAINICQMRMENILPSYAEGVMAYAAKHGYYEIVDKAAPLVVVLPIERVVSLLPQSVVVPWPRLEVLYRQQWVDVLSYALNSRPIVNIKCSRCTQAPQPLMFNSPGHCTCPPDMPKPLELGIRMTLEYLPLYELLAQKAKVCNPKYAIDIERWASGIGEKLVSNVRKFSSFL